MKPILPTLENYLPLPPEYVFGLYTLAATVFTGSFVPNIARYINSSRQKKLMIQYYNELNRLESSAYENENFVFIRSQITEAYAKGSISESQYKLLIEKISELTKSNRPT